MGMEDMANLGKADGADADATRSLESDADASEGNPARLSAPGE